MKSDARKSKTELLTELEALRARVRDLEGQACGGSGASTDALLVNRDLLATVIENVPAIINVKDCEGRCLIANRAQAAFYGWTVEEMIGKLSAEVVDEDYARITWDRDQAVITTGQPLSAFDDPAVDEDGEITMWYTTKSPLKDPDGSVFAVLTVSVDISERIRAEDALRQSEERYSRLLELAPVGIFGHRDGVIVFANRAAVEAFGAGSADEVIGRRSLDFIHPDFREIVRDRNRRALQLGNSMPPMEQVHLRVNGDPFDVEATAAAISYQGERIIMSVIRDITTAKRAEEALRESEERYRGLFEDSPVAIFEEDWHPVREFVDELASNGVVDLAGYFRDHPDALNKAYDSVIRLKISQAAVALYRARDLDEVAKSMNHESVDADVMAGFGDMLAAFQNGQNQYEYDAKETACDDTQIVTRIKSVIPTKYLGNWSRVLVVIEDITDRLRAEEQLRQAQKMEAVGQLTGGIAHDFNNLLAIILGNAELLEDGTGDPMRRAQTIKKMANRGSELTQRLLAFSRQQPLEPTTLDLEVAVEGMHDILSRTLGTDIEIDIRSAKNLWAVIADPGQLENALLNLAINAQQAMPEGGKLILEIENVSLDADFIAAHSGARLGDYAKLSVSDTGTGMSAALQERIFEPFFTTKPVGEGSGLGLSMVYGFATQSGGYVTLDSSEGEGTTIALYLPRSMRTESRPEESGTVQPAKGKGETILVVEDEEDVRSLAVTILEGFGYRVLEAEDGNAALRLMEQGPSLDLLLSDVVLAGGMSGPEVARRARELQPGLKVIFMSGYAGTFLSGQGLPDGATLINKPFTMAALARKIEELLHPGPSG